MHTVISDSELELDTPIRLYFVNANMRRGAEMTIYDQHYR